MRINLPNTEKMIFIANADVPAPPTVQPQPAIVRPNRNFIDCHTEDGAILRLRPHTHLLVSPKAKIQCFSEGKLLSLPIKGVLEFSDKAGMDRRSLCQKSGTALYFVKPGKGRTNICAPKGVKAGIRG
jgi:hypothetical protein